MKYGKENKLVNSEENNRNHKCSNLYLLTISGTCQKYSSLEGTLQQGFVTKLTRNIDRSLVYFKCKNELLVHKGILNDTFANCGIYAVDKLPFPSEYYHTDATVTHCTKPHEIPCQDGSSKCFQLQNICLYEISTYGTLSFCRNGSHLETVNTMNVIQCLSASVLIVSLGHMFVMENGFVHMELMRLFNMSVLQMKHV